VAADFEAICLKRRGARKPEGEEARMLECATKRRDGMTGKVHCLYR